MCTNVGMGWEQLGGRRDGKSHEYTSRWDGKQSGREQDAANRDGRRWEQRPSREEVGKSRSGTKYTRDSRSRHQPVPDPTTFSDLTITARTIGYNSNLTAYNSVLLVFIGHTWYAII